LIDTFEMKRHICMVFELYEMNLRDLLKSRSGNRLPLIMVRSIAQQLLYAFDLIHKFKIIHADCKKQLI
jgi:serine/threonine protein kinase